MRVGLSLNLLLIHGTCFNAIERASDRHDVFDFDFPVFEDPMDLVSRVIVLSIFDFCKSSPSPDFINCRDYDQRQNS